MKRLSHAVAMLAICAVLSPAAVIKFTGTLEPEIAGSSGYGSALVTYDSTARTLTVAFDWNNLTGGTTVAHIHCCVDPPGTVGVATFPGTFPGFPVGLLSGSYESPSPIDLSDPTSYTAGFLNNFGGGTTEGAEAALLSGLRDGRAYLNVHSSFAPGGEIRDFLSEVPEPGTSAMLAGALAALAAYRMRRRSA